MNDARRRRSTAVFTHVLVALPLLLGAGALAWVNLRPAPTESPSQAAFLVRPGDAPPEVKLLDAAGAEVALASVLTPGAPTLLMVLSPDCEHCHTQLRMLAEMRTAEPASVPRVVLVSVGDEQQSADFRRRYAAWEVYEDANLGFQRRYDLRAVPALVLVDAAGVVRGARVGLQTRERLQALLAPPPAKAPAPAA